MDYPRQIWCSDSCKLAIALQHRDKARQMRERAVKKARAQEKKQNRAKKRQLNALKTRKRAAKEACHAYIRERDKNELCICCKKPLGENYNAGHFLESGNNPVTRYDEDNIHGQTVYCNNFKGGDSGDYETNLRKKIGNERVDALKGKRSGTVKRTPDDYAEIERYYKDKLKELRNSRGE